MLQVPPKLLDALFAHMKAGHEAENQFHREARSTVTSDIPVTLPPGRAKLAIMPAATGSFATAKTIGISDVACFNVGTAAPVVTITSTFSRTNSAAISVYRSVFAFRPAVLNGDGATVDPTELAQPQYESIGPWKPNGRGHAQETDSWQLACRLRRRCERPSNCSPRKRRYERSPSNADCHSPYPLQCRERYHTVNGSSVAHFAS